MTTKNTAFGHLRVLDLTGGIAGPFCSKLFADYGADVIKIEPYGIGDVSRSWGPFHKDDPHPEKSLPFIYMNSNKRGVTLNLENAAGREIFRKLVAKADVVLEGFKPGYMAGLDLGYEDLEKINPMVVVTSITPFGQNGPYRDYRGNDLLYYAMSGIMYTSGAHAREPLKHGGDQSYYMAGIIASHATSAALFSATMSGEGQHIDMSIAECVTMHHYGAPTRYSYSGAVERRAPKDEAGSTKGVGWEGIIKVKDGHLGPSRQHGRARPPWIEYATLLGHPEIAPQLEAATPRQVEELLLPILTQQKKFEHFHSAMAEGWVVGVVQTPEDLLKSEQLKERRFWVDVNHPVVGKLKFPGEVYRLPESPWRFRFPAPLLGQHNKEVYVDELGYTQHQFVMLRQTGAI